MLVLAFLWCGLEHLLLVVSVVCMYGISGGLFRWLVASGCDL